jgi:hypothetical protein
MTVIEGPVNRTVALVRQVMSLGDLFMPLKVGLELLNVIGKDSNLRSRIGILVEEGVVKDLDVTSSLDQLGDGEPWNRHPGDTAISRDKKKEP